MNFFGEKILVENVRLKIFGEISLVEILVENLGVRGGDRGREHHLCCQPGQPGGVRVRVCQRASFNHLCMTLDYLVCWVPLVRLPDPHFVGEPEPRSSPFHSKLKNTDRRPRISVAVH